MNQQLTSAIFESVTARLADASVAVFGDFCLDAYWHIHSDCSELSVETHLSINRVTRQHYSLGGAGNVVTNLAALNVRRVCAIGMLGPDLFGRQMTHLFTEIGADLTGLCTTQTDWQTMVYAKPYLDDDELHRFDFGAFNQLAPASVEFLMTQLDRAASLCPVVILNQQVPQGLATPPVIERINRIIAAHPRTRFIVDARNHAGLYRGAMLKLNAHEAARLVGHPQEPGSYIPAADAFAYARQLNGQTGQPVCVTRGENGLIVCDADQIHEIPGIQVTGSVDPVGAGDTVVAMLAAALATGNDVLTAATLANIAASITVRKLQTTGSASPDELRAVGCEPDYIYQPELADDPRRARYADDGEIEVVRALPNKLPGVAHAIFDHDGTISTLREGWEQIMEPMMLRAILGDRLAHADAKLYHKVLDAVRQFIDKTTGVQTLTQMHGLADMVRRFACIPADQILTPAGYKQVYNQHLLEHVNARVGKLSRGELCPEDFLVKNARLLLERLHAQGVKLYLASGTDTADVINEAQAMGYAHLFEGRIYGAIGDIHVETKRKVMRQIIDENRLDGPQFVTFGDGPVEMRASHQCGGIAVGVASDEVRRFGLNASKRARLIRAGADIIVPDFSRLDALMTLLGLN